MGLTSALFTTLTGLNANQSRLDVIGNNIANVNTVGFKAARLDFETLFSSTMSQGSPPDGANGGTNPFQIGLGTKEGAITRNFNDGSREITGVNTELAIEGNGFFVVQGEEQFFTRDGTFKLNSQNQLVNGNGARVQGYGVDTSFNVVRGPLTDIEIPLGSLTVAKATTEVSLAASLNGTGVVATAPTVASQNQLFYAVGAGVSPSATAPTGATLLTDVVDSTNVPFFQAGDLVTIKGQKGTSSIPPRTLTVTGTTTLGDYVAFMQGTLGINTSVTNGAATAPGVTLQASAAPNAVTLQIAGNLGSLNDITLAPADVSIERGGTTLRPFAFTKSATASGESAFTSTTVYDSLGSPVPVNVTISLISKTSTGTTWQFLAESSGDQRGVTTGGLGSNAVVGQGTLQFDTTGNLVTSTGNTLAIDRSGTGAVPLLQFTLDFDNPNALSSANSALAATAQDGFAKGVLRNFAIADTGQIVGSFDNGERRTLGQIVLATFRNNQGLVDRGNNTFVPGSNSGLPVISTPGEFSTGKIVAGALELSNVDLSAEFVRLISASTGFSASSRIITTSNQLLQELLASAR